MKKKYALELIKEGDLDEIKNMLTDDDIVKYIAPLLKVTLKRKYNNITDYLIEKFNSNTKTLIVNSVHSLHSVALCIINNGDIDIFRKMVFSIKNNIVIHFDDIAKTNNKDKIIETYTYMKENYPKLIDSLFSSICRYSNKDIIEYMIKENKLILDDYFLIYYLYKNKNNVYSYIYPLYAKEINDIEKAFNLYSRIGDIDKIKYICINHKNDIESLTDAIFHSIKRKDLNMLDIILEEFKDVWIDKTNMRFIFGQIIQHNRLKILKYFIEDKKVDLDIDNYVISELIEKDLSKMLSYVLDIYPMDNRVKTSMVETIGMVGTSVDVIKVLIDKGFDIHHGNDLLLKLSLTNRHDHIVGYLFSLKK